jgi:hypothetical protein
MTLIRSHKYLAAACLAAPIAVAGLFPLRNLLAAFLVFCIFFAALGIIVLVSFLFGGGVLRCVKLLGAAAAKLHLRPPIPAPASHAAH